MLRFRSGSIAIALTLLAAPPDAAPLRVTRVTPSGDDVPAERQIVLQFDRPVVPVGRMQRRAEELPITIAPELACDWRWLDTSALACQLGETQALRPATRYTLTLRPGLRALDGAELAAPLVHSFLTERPAVVNAWLQVWEAPGRPRIAVEFNQETTAESIARSLNFAVAGGERVDVAASRIEGPEAAWWSLVPSRELPGGRRVALAIVPGLVSTLGPEPGVERRELVRFETFPVPRFVGVSCVDIRGGALHIEAGTPPASAAGCDPLQPVYLRFSSPVGPDALRRSLHVAPDLAGGRPDDDPWDGVDWYSPLEGGRAAGHEYPVVLPGPLRAAAEYRLQARAAQVHDEFGRALAADIELRFRTDHRRPALALEHEASVLESGVDSHLPVVVTNLRTLRLEFDRLDAGGALRHEQRELPVPSAADVAYRFPLRVRDWLGAGSGAVEGRIRSSPSRDDQPLRFFSEVTPFQVHVKLGYSNSLVWVTELASGHPVPGAEVELVELRRRGLEVSRPGLAQARTEADGTARLPGSALLDPDYLLLPYWIDDARPRLAVRVRRGGDFALVPLDRDFATEGRGPRQTWIPRQGRRLHGHVRSWGTTAQGVYRAGDTVQYKLWVREEGNRELEPAPRRSYALRVVDPLDKAVHERAGLELSEFGGLDGEFKLPATAAVGWYRFELRADFARDELWQPLAVLVSDFTPAPFRVTTDLSAERLRDGETLEVATQAALHGGGPYAQAQSRVTAVLRALPFSSADPRAQGFEFGEAEPREEVLHRSDALLDAQGRRQTSFAVHSEHVTYGALAVESAVRDDRGKYVAGRAQARFAGRDRFVGLRQPDWVLRVGQRASLQAVVTDEQGAVVAGVPIDFTVERLRTLAARVKSAGNAYVTQYTHEWQRVGDCRAASAIDPVECRATPDAPGSYRFTASILDTQGRSVQTTLERWAVGAGVLLWEEPPGHHLDIVAEGSELHVGDTARFLVKNPFPGALALVSIERLGVIQHWTQPLPDATALLEFPVEPDFVPGFYLSVVVTSPRVAAAPGGDGVDLGKPAFRLGYVQVPVRDAYKELQVTARAAAASYKPRQRAAVELEARTRQGGPVDVEFAVAVLDEAVLDLLARGTANYDPYVGFHELDPLDLANYNLLKNLIGLRKFEQKGATPGGDGGMSPELRGQFRFVAYWNPALRPGADGKAHLEFEVPDNLTGWRVLAMAVSAEDRMGLGQTRFQVNRPTELRPALPNQVREGDRFEARFTVMNRTDHARKLRVVARAAGAAGAPPPLDTTVQAEPFRRTTLGLPLVAGGPGEIRLELRAGDAEDTDGLRLTVPVRRRVAFETAATYGTMTAGTAVEPVEVPADIRTDVGRLDLVATSSVIGGLDGAFASVRDYPYACWEQKLTKAVMAAHWSALRGYLPADSAWTEAATLPQLTLDAAADFQAPSGGMSYYEPSDDRASPYLSAYTALAFGWLRERGHAVPGGVERKLQDYLLELLRRDAFPEFYSRGMSATVRAVALAALAPAGRLTLDDVLRYRDHVERMDLFGQAHYLLALSAFPDQQALRRQVLDRILAHANQSGGKVTFSERLDDGWSRILHSEPRTSCAILSALAREQDAGDLPFQLVRSLTQERQRRDRWENTQENVFCTNALLDYARAYERDEPRLALDAALGGEHLGSGRLEGRRAPPVELGRPLRAADPGRRLELRLERSGTGRLYYAVRLRYAPRELPAEAANAGIEVRREYSVEREGRWIKLGERARVRQGELVRVDLYVQLPAARNFVVVDDPVPGGLEPVNRDLATASSFDADRAAAQYPADAFLRNYDDWSFFGVTFWSFYHQELRHDSARFYSEYLPAGRYVLSYVAQAIAPGTFSAPALRAEEMYDADVFGRGTPAVLVVEPENP